MSGRKRKRPLQNHKFFDRLPPNVNLVKPTGTKPFMTGYRETYDLSNQEIYEHRPGFNPVTSTCGVPFKISERKKQMQPYLNSLFDCLQQVDYGNWQSKTALLDDGQPVEAKMIRAVITNDESDPLDSTFFKVFLVDSREPIWLPFSQAPIKCVRQLLYRIAAKISQPGKIFKSNKKK
jgi:hypothetical protein